MIIVPVEKKVDWKRPPIVLILLVLINTLVFAFYQSGDNEKYEDAVRIYQKKNLIQKEFGAFRAYSLQSDFPFDVTENDPDLVQYIVGNTSFDRFMRNNHRHYISKKEYKRWRRDRDRVEEVSSEISINAYGQDAANLQPLQLVSHQFLHGDTDHILGNMIFLILTGFAVEAALGSLRFLLFYLLSGIGAGLLDALLGASSGMSLGASGSISGVMAMYVMLFGMRKINFFYWAFIFTGYVRAAAIIMLPIYVGFEVYDYFTNEGSNVGYLAHIGGFLSGALLVFLTQSLNKSGIDEEYIGGKQDEVDPFAQSLNKLYLLIAQCEFNRAWEILKPLKKSNPSRPQLIEIEYNLVRAVHPKKLHDYLRHRMDKPGNSKLLVADQLVAWQNYTDEERNSLSFNKKATLLQNALDVGNLSGAENIFKDIRSLQQHETDVAMLAQRIAAFCQGSRYSAKTSEYNDLARKMAHTTIASPGVS